jgi:glycosyltransferase involved in cell wall biosynthesis
VIIPAYNRLSLLKETIASVQAQTLSDWELIVADDGSTEPIVEYVESLGDPRIVELRLEHTCTHNVARQYLFDPCPTFVDRIASKRYGAR